MQTHAHGRHFHVVIELKETRILIKANSGCTVARYYESEGYSIPGYGHVDVNVITEHF